jgi:uncharacterized membrane protein
MAATLFYRLRMRRKGRKKERMKRVLFWGLICDVVVFSLYLSLSPSASTKRR